MKATAAASTPRDVVKVYLRARKRKLSARTTDRLLDIFAPWLDWLEREGLGMKAFSARAIERYHDEHLTRPTGRHGRTRAPSTVLQHVRSIETLWDWADRRAADEGWTIARQVTLELPGRRASQARAPSWEELDAMIAQLPEGWARRAAVIQRLTGVRINEALSLTWGDVDLVRGEVTWRAELTKGGYGGRRLPLHPELIEALRAWRGEAPAEARVSGCPDAELSGRGHVQRTLTRAWRRAGVDERLWRRQPTHAARKAFYTNLRATGADPDAVRVLVGHRLDGVTAAYLDAAQLPLRELVGRVPGISRAESLPLGGQSSKG